MTTHSIQEEVEVVADSKAARDLTDKIRAGLEGVYQLIVQAFQQRVWRSLGYASWDEYVRREFGNLSLRPPLEERQEVVQSLRDSGLSTRAIGSATQLSQPTIWRTLNDSGDSNESPDDGTAHEPSKVVGLDGKEYSSSEPTGSPRVNETDPGVLDAVLDTSAEDVGVKILDSETMGQKRSEHAEKILSEFHGSDIAVLPKSMFLAEKVGSLVSPVSGAMEIDEDAYADVAKDIAAALRQFSYVAKTLAGAEVEFENQQLLDIVIDDLQFANNYLATTVSEMKGKK